MGEPAPVGPLTRVVPCARPAEQRRRRATTVVARRLGQQERADPRCEEGASGARGAGQRPGAGAGRTRGVGPASAGHQRGASQTTQRINLAGMPVRGEFGTAPLSETGLQVEVGRADVSRHRATGLPAGLTAAAAARAGTLGPDRPLFLPPSPDTTFESRRADSLPSSPCWRAPFPLPEKAGCLAARGRCCCARRPSVATSLPKERAPRPRLATLNRHARLALPPPPPSRSTQAS